jgi:glycosyltransferase involved in cell wall biosynthesis
MEGGGSERQMAALIRNLDRSRFAPELFLLHRRGSLLETLPADLPIHCYDELAPPFYFNWPGRIRNTQIRCLRKLIVERRIDLVYDRALHMTQIAGPASDGLNISRVSTVVAAPMKDFENYEKRYRWLKRRLLARAYRSADKVLAVSRDLAAEIQRCYHIPSNQVQVLYSPIDQENILRQAAESNFVIDPPNVELRILCVGRISDSKGQRDLLEAAKIVLLERNRRIAIHFVGDGPLRKQLQRETELLGLSEQIQFHGFAANPYPYFRKADLLCLPSLYEGLPNVVMEAMFLGVPVLATDCPTGPRELLGDQRYGTLVPVKNPSALADAIVDRIDNPSAWVERTQAAKAIATERHQLKTWIGALERLFQATVDARKRR